ncbi:MAG: AAA family ATPase [Hydrogenophaga sp.]|uniref:McrB family protein n=1 Tax=Hydrogenophaga sp. TaxID=1904254 RepID=UPI002610A0B8|nr:AAA family ATPase [Hydrogenophaga sp.]MDM7943524.1 AAA family ATPase [Hydrogenophaga sp.]
MTLWTDQLPNDFERPWQETELAHGRAANWIRFFLDYSQNNIDANNHFKSKFFGSEQLQRVIDTGLTQDSLFEMARKIASKLLELTPSAATTNSGYDNSAWPEGPPIYFFGRAQRRFRAPSCGLVYGAYGNQASNFYIVYRESKEVIFNTQATSDGHIGPITPNGGTWKIILPPISIDAQGSIAFEGPPEVLHHSLTTWLTDFLSSLENHIQHALHHESILNAVRPDGVPSVSPIYPKLISHINIGDGLVGPIDPANPVNPLNSILFGPPGTGKTYRSTVKSLHLLGLQDGSGNTHQKFFKACKEGDIVFTTFHQSYSYEDFIEGIRVNTNELKEVEYKIRNGIFKRIARKALFHKAAYAAGFGATSGIDQFADLYSETLDESLTSSSEIFEKIEGARRILQKIEQWKSNPLDATVSDADEQAEKERVFVLIVDEINRGNISKIFGELITLIEDNKRLGSQDVLSVTLPYSGEQFFVPDNLYIVGTMNTADRSLAALDVALRRRFVFEEMMPDFGMASPISAVNVPGVNVRAWMIKVNQRIQAERGREFTIGHAFFMPLTATPTMNELASIMKLKILPLLEEYFFDDWDGIRYVLDENDTTPPNQRFVEVTSVVGRSGNHITIFGWNEAALSEPAAYR